MRLRRRFASVTVAFALGVASLGVAESAAARPHRPREVSLQVLSFNDFHGHLQPPSGTDATLGTTLDPSNTLVGGAEHLASTLDRLRHSARHSHTVAAGDLIGGSPFLSGLFHDEPAVESLNAMGLDVSSVGNHEFDEGVEELQRMQEGDCHPTTAATRHGAQAAIRAQTSTGWPPTWWMSRRARPCSPAAPSAGSEG